VPAITRKQALVLLSAALAGPLGYSLLSLVLVAPVSPASAVLARTTYLVGQFLVVASTLGWAFILLGVPVLVWTHRLSRVLLLSLPISLIGFVLRAPLQHVRESWLAQAIQQADSIILALEAYRSRLGAYPPTLSALVPAYLPALPSTGMLAYPAFGYRVNSEVPNATSPYELRVEMPMELNADVLVYWPGRVYPERLYDGAVTALDGWAYIRD
jgi:hypothetical protein